MLSGLLMPLLGRDRAYRWIYEPLQLFMVYFLFDTMSVLCAVGLAMYVKNKIDMMWAAGNGGRFDAMLMSAFSVMTLGDVALGRLMMIVGIYHVQTYLYAEVRVQAKRLAQNIGERILEVR